MSRGFFVILEVSTPLRLVPHVRNSWPVLFRVMWLWFAVALVPTPWSTWMSEWTKAARDLSKQEPSNG